MAGKKTKTMAPPAVSRFTDYDIYLFKKGEHYSLYEKFGSHPMEAHGIRGTYFAVWAPNAERVSVIGDFNNWDGDANLLGVRWDESGIWEGFIPGVGKGCVYKYHIVSKYHGYKVDKSDPFAMYCEVPPKSASIIWDTSYSWNDGQWMGERGRKNSLGSPISIYEIHLGSWRRVPEEGHRQLTYRELSPYLIKHIQDTGFTHIQFMPIMEHPFYGSWGYQISGYYAPTSRYGSPEELKELIDDLHRSGIGVILDWVPSHFPSDEHGLGYFDGTHLYEHSDPREGFHPDWKSYIYNYGRNEVRSFLISNALFWLDSYHIDGLRMDAVASMLYLDYSRNEGEWIPNEFGGRENFKAVHFLKKCNEAVYQKFPDVQMIAEESTDWPMVSRPTYAGGLGFGMKWNMGWMHDTLMYMTKDPIHRKYHHQNLTFSIWYAFSENFILPLSHDEVVHGKGSLLAKMPGDDPQKFAGLRLLIGYQYAHPGKKLLFMGGEWGQWSEWNHEQSLDWHLLDYGPHKGVLRWVSALNSLYRGEPCLHERDCENEGFEWINLSDWEGSVISFLRKGKADRDWMLVVCNFTPVRRTQYRVGVPWGGVWTEKLNSDDRAFHGGGWGNGGAVRADDIPCHGRPSSLSLTLPSLGILFFTPSPG